MKRSIPALVILLAACGGGGDKPSDGSAKPQSSSAASGSAAAAKPEAPKNVDAKVAEELKKVGGCERKEGHVVQDCAADTAWRDFSKAYTEEDDENATKAKKLADTCLSLISDPNETIREVAADCVSRGGAEGDKNAMNLVLTQLEKESGSDARAALAEAADGIDVQKTGATERVIALVKKFKDDENSFGATKNLLWALSKGDDLPPAAYDVAADILTNGKSPGLKETAADVIGRAKSKAADGCKTLLGLVETGKYPWGSGLGAMGQLGCKTEAPAVIAAVVKKMGEEDGYDKGFKGADFIYLQRYMDKVQLEKADKDKLKKATEDLAGKTKNDNVKADTKKLLEKLK